MLGFARLKDNSKFLIQNYLISLHMNEIKSYYHGWFLVGKIGHFYTKMLIIYAWRDIPE